MPIAMICPGCSAKLNVPDSAAGKKVKCPKPGCGTLMIVPEPLPEAEESPKPRPKLVKAVVDDEDDRPRTRRRRDDDDEDEDRPRKKKKRKQAGLSPAVLAGIVVGGILVLGGVGYGVYALAFKKSDEAKKDGGGGGGAKAAVPAGWVAYTSQSDKFKAYFPKEPQAGPFAVPNAKLPPAKSITRYTAGTPTDDRSVLLFVAQLPAGSTQADRDAYAEDFNKTFRAGVGVVERSATWAGQPAKEFVITKPATKTRPESGGVVRQMTVGDTLYGVVISSNSGPVPAEVINGFFDNFELLN